jgi:hypothetical protein
MVGHGVDEARRIQSRNRKVGAGHGVDEARRIQSRNRKVGATPAAATTTGSI